MFFLLVRISWVTLENLFMIILISYLRIHSSLTLCVLNTRTWISVQHSRDVVGALCGDPAASRSRAETAFLMHPEVHFSGWWLSCIHSSESCDLLLHSNPSLSWSCPTVFLSRYRYGFCLSLLSSCTWLSSSCYILNVMFFLYTQWSITFSAPVCFYECYSLF